MIHSMTAFGSSRIDSEQGSLTVEFRTVNSRYLDIHIRIPDELRVAEPLIREHVGQYVTRGKVDIRVSLVCRTGPVLNELDAARLEHMARQLEMARRVIPDVAAPRLLDLLAGQTDHDDPEPDAGAWTQEISQVCVQALEQLKAARRREGRRLSEMMLVSAHEMGTILDTVEKELPALTQEYHDRITARLRDVLDSISPDGFSQISGDELSARIAQEASLFSLRNDIAEELARLRSHLKELSHLLAETPEPDKAAGSRKHKSSAGKRLDFLCQEMNREANTIGSKAASLNTTRAAIDLKLLIEQLREQAQNIE